MAESIAENIERTKKALWYRCRCGIVFQENPPPKVPETQAHIDKILKRKEHESVCIHAARTYIPLIEEMTYGRKLLDVGFTTEHNMNYLKSRGWVTYGIDSNETIIETDRIIQDDFETTQKLVAHGYNCVWMNMVLEKFHDPVGAIARAHEVLEEDGVLFIATPDTDFLYTIPSPMFQYWRKDKNFILWNPASLTKVLEHLGFEVVMLRRNIYQRFGSYFNMHVVAQKIFC